MTNALPALKRLLSAVEAGAAPYPGDVEELQRAVEAIASGDRYTPSKLFGRGVGRPRTRHKRSEVAAVAVQRVRDLMAQGKYQKDAVEWLTARTHLKRVGPTEVPLSEGGLYAHLVEERRRKRAEFLREIDATPWPPKP